MSPCYGSMVGDLAISSIAWLSVAVMFTRVLTPLERQQVKTFLRYNGPTTSAIQVIVSRGRKYLPNIKADVELLERVIQMCEASKKTTRSCWRTAFD